jgi:hypothetical protein
MALFVGFFIVSPPKRFRLYFSVPREPQAAMERIYLLSFINSFILRSTLRSLATPTHQFTNFQFSLSSSAKIELNEFTHQR